MKTTKARVIWVYGQDLGTKERPSCFQKETISLGVCVGGFGLSRLVLEIVKARRDYTSSLADPEISDMWELWGVIDLLPIPSGYTIGM